MLIGVIHLPALPGSPLSALSMAQICSIAAEDAKRLQGVGFDAIVVENFGDAPFFRGASPAITVSAMTAAALAVRAAAPNVVLCINVLRNDAASALAIAGVCDADAIRVNIHVGARVTDQGVIESDAAHTLRLRAALGLAPAIATQDRDDATLKRSARRRGGVHIWADVDVKHSSALGAVGPGDGHGLAQEVEDVLHRGLASAVVVTGEGTGKGVSIAKLRVVAAASKGFPVLIGSGASAATLSTLMQHAGGVIVGSALRKGGRAGGRIDRRLAAAFARAYRAATK
jgi:uncharacterized protein